MAEAPDRRADDVPADAAEFILHLARALHGAGYDADRLEGALGLAARRLGLTAQFFSTPTSVFASFGRLERQRTYMIRVSPGDVDLGRLAELDRVTKRVLRGTLTPTEGSARVAEIVAAPPRYRPALTVAAFALASGSSTVFLGGGLRETVAATVLGLVIGLLALLAQRYAAVGRVFEPVAAFVAAFLATGATMIVGRFSVFVATLAGLIVLVPGLTLTTAMIELSTKHLSSGTSRMSAAFTTFVGIIFGVAIGNTLGGRVFGVPPAVTPAALPEWATPIALVVASLSFMAILGSETRDAPWVFVMGALAVYGSAVGGLVLGPDLGSFVGALAVGIASNLAARALDRPSAVFLVPGILLLVPGSVGVRSLAALMDREVLSGIETAFRVVVIAMAIVGGVLAANVVARGSRELSSANREA